MISIRPIETRDFDQWKPLYEGYLIFYKTEPEDKQIQSVWERLNNSESGIYGFVAVDETNKILGLTHYLFHANVKFEEPVCYLQDLFSTPEARGKGVGRALIERVHQEAKSKGAVQTYWMTQEFNYHGRILYDKVGEKTPFIKYQITS